MKAIGMVFLYDREIGSPEEVSKDFSKYFASVNENLVLNNVLNLVDLKEILDEHRIYWAGIKDIFLEVINNDELMGSIAWKVFVDKSGIKPSDQINVVFYDKNEVPWKFSLLTCIFYEPEMENN